MLTAEEAYLKKVYDGTAKPDRLNIEYIITGQGSNVNEKDKESYRVTTTTLTNLSVSGRARLDSIPITPWSEILVFGYTPAVSPSNNNNNSGGY